jgi:hypothetical protein
VPAQAARAPPRAVIGGRTGGRVCRIPQNGAIAHDHAAKVRRA